MDACAAERYHCFELHPSQRPLLIAAGTQFDQARIKLVSTISGKTHGEAMFPWNSGIEFSTRLHSAPHTFYIMPKVQAVRMQRAVTAARCCSPLGT